MNFAPLVCPSSHSMVAMTAPRKAAVAGSTPALAQKFCSRRKKIAAVFASFPLSIFYSFVVFGKTDRDVCGLLFGFLFSCHFRASAARRDGED